MCKSILARETYRTMRVSSVLCVVWRRFIYFFGLTYILYYYIIVFIQPIILFIQHLPSQMRRVWLRIPVNVRFRALKYWLDTLITWEQWINTFVTNVRCVRCASGSPSEKPTIARCYAQSIRFSGKRCCSCGYVQFKPNIRKIPTKVERILRRR